MSSFARIFSASVQGMQVTPIELEVDIQPGLPYFKIIGLPDKQIDEARSRVVSAIKNSGFKFPLGKVTVNLSPSRLPKKGTGFDLALAIGVLTATGVVPVCESLFLGELSLDGNLRPHSQLLQILIYALDNDLGCIVPASNEEVALLPEVKSIKAGTLSEVVDLLHSPLVFQSKMPPTKTISRSDYLIDRVKGQEMPKRVLEIALAGKHNVLLEGPPGSGKTMLAKSAQELLPSLTRANSLDVMQLQVLAKLSPNQNNFRAPLPSISQSSLLGGGNLPTPGEISLAHKGILFLDEFSQLQKSVSESLRQPLEDKQITIMRRGQETIYPADCLVIAAQNACPCGLSGVEGEECRCSSSDILHYSRAHSEALLERFDLYSLVPKIDFSEYSLAPERKGKDMAERIARVRKVQEKRIEVVDFLHLSTTIQDYLLKASQKFYLSARGMERIVRVAQTIADLEGVGEIMLTHVQEALQYRRRAISL